MWRAIAPVSNWVLRGKRLGLQLAEIRDLIDMYDAPRDTTAQLKHYLSVLKAQRETLEQQKHDIEEILAEILTQQTQCETLLSKKT